jgi:lipopolysaccharide biosynthesis glycosyltransferase
MKCVFTVTDKDPGYIRMAKVFVLSAQMNSNLDLYCIYDGGKQEFISWLKNRGIPCIKWKVTFLDKIRDKYTGKKSIDYCAGAYLCIEIPLAFEASGIDDQYILYIDVDTMVLNNFSLDHKNPKYFAGAPDWGVSDLSFIGASVMVINLKQVKKDYPKFLKHLLKHNFDFSFAGHGPCSQGAWNTFYRNKWDKLEPTYDWKPWWGFNPQAKIVHFSGPKPYEIQPLLVDDISAEESERDKINRFVVKQNPESYKKYLQVWNKYDSMINR